MNDDFFGLIDDMPDFGYDDLSMDAFQQKIEEPDFEAPTKEELSQMWDDAFNPKENDNAFDKDFGALSQNVKPDALNFGANSVPEQPSNISETSEPEEENSDDMFEEIKSSAYKPASGKLGGGSTIVIPPEVMGTKQGDAEQTKEEPRKEPPKSATLGGGHSLGGQIPLGGSTASTTPPESPKPAPGPVKQEETVKENEPEVVFEQATKSHIVFGETSAAPNPAPKPEPEPESESEQQVEFIDEPVGENPHVLNGVNFGYTNIDPNKTQEGQTGVLNSSADIVVEPKKEISKKLKHGLVAAAVLFLIVGLPVIATILRGNKKQKDASADTETVTTTSVASTAAQSSTEAEKDIVFVTEEKDMAEGNKEKKKTETTLSSSVFEEADNYIYNVTNESAGSSRFSSIDDLTLYLDGKMNSALSTEKQGKKSFEAGQITYDELKVIIKDTSSEVDTLNHLLLANKNEYKKNGKIGDYETLKNNMEILIVYGDIVLYDAAQ